MRNCALTLSLLLWLVVPAYSHAILLSATPTMGEVCQGPNVPIKLRFNSRVDAGRSRLILVAPDGEQGMLAISGISTPDSLVAQAKGLRRGLYVLRWQVLAGDGHISRGEVKFLVH
jgi:methionine-rich copper-binding protein CopC